MNPRRQPDAAAIHAPPAPAARLRTKVWLRCLALVVVVGATVGGAWFWRQQMRLERRRADLPPLPDVSAQPAALGAALRAAEQTAVAAAHPGEGVEELGRLDHANGFSREAEACWRILHAAQPREARWCYYLADLRRTAGDDAGMVGFLRQTMQLAPDYAPAWLNLAEWEFKTGQLDAAEHDYGRRLALVPGDPYARLGLARIALQRGRRDESKRMIEQIVRDVPAFPTAHNLYAEMLAADGDAEDATQQRWLGRIAGRFREADDPWLEELHAWCYDPSRLAVWASIEYQTKHGDRGKSLLGRVLELAPDDPRGYLQLGKLYLDLGEADRARAVLEQGIKLPETPSLMYVNLSQAYCDLHRPAEAARVAEQGLTAHPNAPELQNALGVSLRAAGRVEEALVQFQRSIEGSPTVAEPNFSLGLALLQLGRRDEACDYFKRALALEPTHPKALAALGQTELEAGRLAAAAQYLQPLFKFYPGLEAARRLMTQWCLQAGMAEVRAGRLAGAEDRFREGVAISPDRAELHGRLGLIYAQQRRLPEALDQFETFRRLQPNDPRAALFLGRAYADLGRLDDARRTLAEGGQLARQAGDAATAAQCDEALRRLSP
jgi:tetratricopeptide (TPR) repeat protein